MKKNLSPTAPAALLALTMGFRSGAVPRLHILIRNLHSLLKTKANVNCFEMYGNAAERYDSWQWAGALA